MKIWIKPTGSVIRGHVLDCAVGPLVEKLRDYDPQLYVRWNPRKLRGWGLWEIRRKPESLSVKSVDVCQGNTIVCLDYVENNLVNHVIDVPFLNYKIIEKIRNMDQWKNDQRGADYGARLEYEEAKWADAVEDKVFQEREYNIKQHRSQFRDFREYVLSGGNPYRIADYWR